MRIDIMTLFPETVGDMMNESILGRAQERGYIRIEAHQIRDPLPLLGIHSRGIWDAAQPYHLPLPLRDHLLPGQGPAAAGGL